MGQGTKAPSLIFPEKPYQGRQEIDGRLDKELQRLSVAYEAELDRNMRMLVSLAEPLMLFVTAAVIGTVVLAMLLPILTLQDVVH